MSDIYKVSYSPAAQDDIRAIFAYIAFELQVEQAAQGQVNRIREAVRKLDTMPEIIYHIINLFNDSLAEVCQNHYRLMLSLRHSISLF